MPPRVLVTASGIGFAGDAGDDVVDEASPYGTSSSPRVCVAWEAAARGGAGAARGGPHGARGRPRRARGAPDGAPVPPLRRRPGSAAGGSGSRGSTSTTSCASTGSRSTTRRSRARSTRSRPEQLRQRDAARDFGARAPPAAPRADAGVRAAAAARRAGRPAPPRPAGRLAQARRLRVPLPRAARRARGRARVSGRRSGPSSTESLHRGNPTSGVLEQYWKPCGTSGGREARAWERHLAVHDARDAGSSRRRRDGSGGRARPIARPRSSATRRRASRSSSARAASATRSRRQARSGRSGRTSTRPGSHRRDRQGDHRRGRLGDEQGGSLEYTTHMTAYKGVLSAEQIQNVSAYVYLSTHK